MNFKQVAKHPMAFAAVAGVANGVIAAVRKKPLSPTAMVVTSLVVAAGEVALVLDVPESEREVPMLDLGILSVAGTMAGLMPFTEWEKGEGSFAHHATKYVGSKVSDATERLLAAKRSVG